MTDGELNPEMVANLTTKHTPEQLAAMYLRAELQIGKNADEISGLLVSSRGNAAKLGAATRELKNLRHAEPLAREITAILKLWRALCTSPAKRNEVCIELDSTRATIVRAALKTHTTGSPKDRRRMCMDAVRGLALRPYVVNAQRMAHGAAKQRYCDVEHALGGEKKAAQRIEEHAGFYRMAQAKPLEWKQAASDAALAVWMHWYDVYTEASYRDTLERSKERLRNDQEAAEAFAAESGFTLEQLGAAIEGRPIPSVEKPRLFVVPDPESEAA